jgi:hypothetical protein
MCMQEAVSLGGATGREAIPIAPGGRAPAKAGQTPR